MMEIRTHFNNLEEWYDYEKENGLYYEVISTTNTCCATEYTCYVFQGDKMLTPQGLPVTVIVHDDENCNCPHCSCGSGV